MILFGKLISRRHPMVILTICISIISMLVSLFWNLQLSEIINQINNKVPLSKHNIFIALLTILISSILSFTLGIFSGYTCETLSHDLRLRYATHLVTLPYSEIETLNEGEYLSKLQNEIIDISSFLCGNFFPLINDCIRFLTTLSFMLWLNHNLTILSHLPVILLVFYTIYTSKIIGRTANKIQEANTQINGYLNTLITLFPILQIYNAMPFIQSKHNETLHQWEALSIKEESTRAKLMSLSAFLSYIPLLLLFLIGGIRVIKNELSIGTLYIFINLSGNTSNLMMNIPGRIALLRRFTVNMKRIESTILQSK